jgi:uncharacterized UBP type Zn finger protein
MGKRSYDERLSPRCLSGHARYNPDAVQTKNRYPYQLAAVISHLGNPEKDQGHYMTFLRIFGQWIRFNDTEVEAVEESAALHENLPET